MQSGRKMILLNRLEVKFVLCLCILLLDCSKQVTTSVTADFKLITDLSIAIDILKGVKNVTSAFTDLAKPGDCADLLKLGNYANGVYRIWPRNRIMEGRSLEVFCDMQTDGGGWTLIQRRGKYVGSPAAYFYKNWKEYKAGFGNLNKDFWLGNDNIFAITNQMQYSVRFDLQNFEGDRRYAMYETFWIDDEKNQYMLHISGFSGDAGDAMIPHHDKQKFSTYDVRNDNRDNTVSCAVAYRGAWWYNGCYASNLNGIYMERKPEIKGEGINWREWFSRDRMGMMDHKVGSHLYRTEIKVRPKMERKQNIAMLSLPNY